MNTKLQASLIGNAYGFALHWIYDPAYIEQLILKEDVFFKAPLKRHYEEALSSYYGYPYGKAGDVTTQGMFLIWLCEALSHNPNLSVQEYKELLLSHIMPGQDYVGYIESYAKKLIANEIALTMDHEPIFEMNDDHLVGFVPYIAIKALNLPTSKAKELATLFSSDQDYGHLFDLFDAFLSQVTSENKQELIKKIIESAPETFKTKLKHAISDEDDWHFIEQHSGIACVIPQSIPLIFRIIHRASTYEEAMLMNVKYGGAISERAMMLGLVFSHFSEVPSGWLSQCNEEIIKIVQAL
jgi:hypothetical protein